MKNSEKAFVDYCKGYTQQEIANKRNVKLGTVKSWSQRGINGTSWVELKKQCTKDDGSIDITKASRMVGGKGNLSPSLAGSANLTNVWNTNKYNTPENRSDISEALESCMKWYGSSPVKNDDECRDRLFEFFKVCIESGEMLTVEKMCLALGYSYGYVWEWEQGRLGTVRADLIKNGKQMIWAFEGEMALKGKINPVTYIFRAKNYFGMRDVVDSVITHNDPMGNTGSKEDIERRLQELDNIPSDN